MLAMFGWMFLIFLVIPLTAMLSFVLFVKATGTQGWFERNASNFKKAGLVVLGLAIVWYFAVGARTGQQWNGEGMINVFASAGDAKNYRLQSGDIEVTIKRQGLFRNYKYYRVTSAEWPNGGSLDFKGKGCFISELDGGNKCEAADGTIYYVEVQTPPDQPESDYSDN